jgi:hypothetical protein
MEILIMRRSKLAALSSALIAVAVLGCADNASSRASSNDASGQHRPAVSTASTANPLTFSEKQDALTGSTISTAELSGENDERTLIGKMKMSCSLPSKRLAVSIESYSLNGSGVEPSSAPLIDLKQRWGTVGDTLWTSTFNGPMFVVSNSGMQSFAVLSRPFNNVIEMDVTAALASIVATQQSLRGNISSNDSLLSLKKRDRALAVASDSIADMLRKNGLAYETWREGYSDRHEWLVAGHGEVYANRSPDNQQWLAPTRCATGNCTTPIPPVPENLLSAIREWQALTSQMKKLQDASGPFTVLLSDASDDRTNEHRNQNAAQLEEHVRKFGDLSSVSNSNALITAFGPDWVFQYKTRGGTNTLVLKLADADRIISKCQK